MACEKVSCLNDSKTRVNTCPDTRTQNITFSPTYTSTTSRKHDSRVECPLIIPLLEYDARAQLAAPDCRGPRTRRPRRWPVGVAGRFGVSTVG